MPGVALEPVPGDLVARSLFVQRAPEVVIFHRLLRLGLPPIDLPAMNPGRDAVFDVIRVRVEIDQAGSLERGEGLDGSLEFHPVIRRRRDSAADFLGLSVTGQRRRPSAHAGVALASAVSMNDDVFHVAYAVK